MNCKASYCGGIVCCFPVCWLNIQPMPSVHQPPPPPSLIPYTLARSKKFFSKTSTVSIREFLKESRESEATSQIEKKKIYPLRWGLSTRVLNFAGGIRRKALLLLVRFPGEVLKSQIQPERSTHSPTEVKETLN